MMAAKKKPRDYRNIWLLSLVILVFGIVFTVNMALVRPLGFALLVIGAVGIVWSLMNMGKGEDPGDRNDPWHLN